MTAHIRLRPFSCFKPCYPTLHPHQSWPSVAGLKNYYMFIALPGKQRHPHRGIFSFSFSFSFAFLYNVCTVLLFPQYNVSHPPKNAVLHPLTYIPLTFCVFLLVHFPKPYKADTLNNRPSYFRTHISCKQYKHTCESYDLV